MHVTLAGLGNIGSYAAQLIARTPRVTELTLIDRDVYDEERNFPGQAMERCDGGKPKAKVQARRLHKLHPAMKITAICDSIENVPAGLLQSDVLVAAVDTRVTRQHLGQLCWSLGLTWIDSGVNAEGGLVSVSTYVPGRDSACIECGWGERHYATLEIPYACTSSIPAARTNAPASLGGLAGALLAIECGKLLEGATKQSLAGRQIVYDTQWNKHHVVEHPRNPRCRFRHHTLPVATALVVFHDAPLAEVFAMTDLKTAQLAVVGSHGFAKHAFCAGCGTNARDLWRLVRGLRCPRCKQALTVTGFDSVAELKQAELPAAVLQRPLRRLGPKPGDILVLRNEVGEECVRVRGVDA